MSTLSSSQLRASYEPSQSEHGTQSATFRSPPSQPQATSYERQEPSGCCFPVLLMRTKLPRLSRYLEMYLATSHDTGVSTPLGYEQSQTSQATSGYLPPSHGPLLRASCGPPQPYQAVPINHGYESLRARLSARHVCDPATLIGSGTSHELPPGQSECDVQPVTFTSPPLSRVSATSHPRATPSVAPSQSCPLPHHSSHRLQDTNYRSYKAEPPRPPDEDEAQPTIKVSGEVPGYEP